MRRIAATVVLACAALVAGCSQTIQGNPVPLGAGSSSGHPDYPKLTKECLVVEPDKIATFVGAESMDSGFTGAICRWDGQGSSGTSKVTMNWFETGSLQVERKVNEQLGYSVSDVTVQGGRGIKEQRPHDPDSCGVTVAAFDEGVLGWWVQYMPGSGHPDPCPVAQKLAEASLNLNR